MSLATIYLVTFPMIICVLNKAARMQKQADEALAAQGGNDNEVDKNEGE